MADAIARFEAAYGERVGALPAPPADARPVRSGPVTATVTGVAHDRGGSAGEGRRIMLWDGTGHLDVWCPPEIRGLGLLAGRPPFRIEIEAGHRTAPRARPDLWPFGDPVPPGGLPATRAALLAHLPPQATATIVHPT